LRSSVRILSPRIHGRQLLHRVNAARFGGPGRAAAPGDRGGDQDLAAEDPGDAETLEAHGAVEVISLEEAETAVRAKGVQDVAPPPVAVSRPQPADWVASIKQLILRMTGRRPTLDEIRGLQQEAGLEEECIPGWLGYFGLPPLIAAQPAVRKIEAAARSSGLRPVYYPTYVWRNNCPSPTAAIESKMKTSNYIKPRMARCIFRLAVAFKILQYLYGIAARSPRFMARRSLEEITDSAPRDSGTPASSEPDTRDLTRQPSEKSLAALRSLVVDSVSLPNSKRSSGPEQQGLARATINVHVSGLRWLGAEAADNKGASGQGVRTGNWLTKEQAETILRLPDLSTLKGKRDRALLSLLIGCGLRRSEAAALNAEDIQPRDGRWVIPDLVGKHNRIRTVPMPGWTKVAIDIWLAAARITNRRVFRACTRATASSASHSRLNPFFSSSLTTAIASELSWRRTMHAAASPKLAHRGPRRSRTDPDCARACVYSDNRTLLGRAAGPLGCSVRPSGIGFGQVILRRTRITNSRMAG